MVKSGKKAKNSPNEDDRERVKVRQIPLRMPDEVYRKLRILAAVQDKTMNEFIVHLIEKDYDSAELDLPEQRKRSLPKD